MKNNRFYTYFFIGFMYVSTYFENRARLLFRKLDFYANYWYSYLHMCTTFAKICGPIDVIQGHLINFRYCDWWNGLRYSEM